jgi:hypothetical protein
MTLSLFAAAFLLMLFPAALILVGQGTVHAWESSPIFIFFTICLPLPLIAIGLFCTYQGVVNAVRALSDKPIRYTLSIPFVK